MPRIIPRAGETRPEHHVSEMEGERDGAGVMRQLSEPMILSAAALSSHPLHVTDDHDSCASHEAAQVGSRVPRYGVHTSAAHEEPRVEMELRYCFPGDLDGDEVGVASYMGMRPGREGDVGTNVAEVRWRGVHGDRHNIIVQVVGEIEDEWVVGDNVALTVVRGLELDMNPNLISCLGSVLSCSLIGVLKEHAGRVVIAYGERHAVMYTRRDDGTMRASHPRRAMMRGDGLVQVEDAETRAEDVMRVCGDE
jgi:hypothetical protein